MRNIDEVVIHHSYTSKDLDFTKTINSINKNHAKRFGRKYPNPAGLWIEYHYLIGPNGEIKITCPESYIAYHASNWPVNQKSIGICLIGNFDKETPNPKQLFALRDLLKEIKLEHYIKKVTGHRAYSSKSCPGLNMTDKIINEAFHPKPNA